MIFGAAQQIGDEWHRARAALPKSTLFLASRKVIIEGGGLYSLQSVGLVRHAEVLVVDAEGKRQRRSHLPGVGNVGLGLIVAEVAYRAGRLFQRIAGRVVVERTGKRTDASQHGCKGAIVGHLGGSAGR